MRATQWDVIVLARAAGVAAVTLGLAWLITAASDEGAISWGSRAGRTLPLTPLCSAVGVWGALAHVRARGDVRALEALGRTPAETAAAAVVGGALVALVAAGLMGAVSAVDVSGFYPVATQTTAWQWRSGAFEDAEQGLRVGADGAPIRLAAPSAATPNATLPAHGRLAAALATALSALAMAALTARTVLAQATPSRGDRRANGVERGFTLDALASGLAATATVVLFQATAAHRAPALAGVIPPLALLLLALQRYRATP